MTDVARDRRRRTAIWASRSCARDLVPTRSTTSAAREKSRRSVVRCGASLDRRVAPANSQVRRGALSRIASTKPSARRGAKPSSHQRPITSTRLSSRSMRGSIRPTKRSRNEDRQHVPAPSSLRRRVEELPDVVELEQGSEQRPVPDERVERRQERDRRRRLRRILQQPDLVLQDEALPAHALDRHGDELAVLDQLLAQRRSAGISGQLGSGLAGPMPPKMSPPPPTPSRPCAR